MTEMDNRSEIDEARADLDAMDAELLELLARRLQVVARIKSAKRASGKHVFDRERERQVVEKAMRAGAALGLPNPLVHGVMSAVLEASHSLQESEEPDVGVASEVKRLLIVGGAGKMGQRLGRAFAQRGHHIDVLEKDDTFDAQRIERADVVVIAVPMSEASGVARVLGPMIRSDALLCDINSLKRDVCTTLAAHCVGEAMGTHPMFGPTVGSLRRQKVVLCSVKDGPMSAWLRSELGRMGAEVIDSDPDTHDKMMAIVQVLTHFGMMVMGRSLSHTGVPLRDTLAYMSPIYRLEVSMIGRLFSQKPELYREILMRNPFGDDFRRLFVEQAQQLATLISDSDRDAFVNSFRETSAFFSEFSAEAMALSDEIIDTIMSRP
jgi:chorismate mutase/prephenate dehydrogenase